jgi:hypothetical protein
VWKFQSMARETTRGVKGDMDIDIYVERGLVDVLDNQRRPAARRHHLGLGGSAALLAVGFAADQAVDDIGVGFQVPGHSIQTLVHAGHDFCVVP